MTRQELLVDFLRDRLVSFREPGNSLQMPALVERAIEMIEKDAELELVFFINEAYTERERHVMYSQEFLEHWSTSGHWVDLEAQYQQYLARHLLKVHRNSL